MTDYLIQGINPSLECSETSGEAASGYFSRFTYPPEPFSKKIKHLKSHLKKISTKALSDSVVSPQRPSPQGPGSQGGVLSPPAQHSRSRPAPRSAPDPAGRRCRTSPNLPVLAPLRAFGFCLSYRAELLGSLTLVFSTDSRRPSHWSEPHGQQTPGRRRVEVGEQQFGLVPQQVVCVF